MRAIDPKDVLDELGVPIGPARLKCALLSYKVLQGAVRGEEIAWPEEAEARSEPILRRPRDGLPAVDRALYRVLRRPLTAAAADSTHHSPPDAPARALHPRNA